MLLSTPDIPGINLAPHHLHLPALLHGLQQAGRLIVGVSMARADHLHLTLGIIFLYVLVDHPGEAFALVTVNIEDK